jgi:hypothetical protein
VNTETGELTAMPDAPYLSPPSDGTSGPSPKEVDISSDGQFAFANHGGTAHIKGFSIDSKTGALTPIENSYFNIGDQGDSGAMTVMGDILFVTRKYGSTEHGPAGVFSLTINNDGTLKPNGDVHPTDGSLPWEVAAWPGVVSPCPADISKNQAVDVDDLLAVINAWNAKGENPADITNNGIVDVDDLLAVINAWGPC